MVEPAKKTRLFISHASEDKPDFVRPLADALREHYDVWYDEYSLTMGQRLLEEINKGLASCDYGIVVLSPQFFLKKWPRAELDGLFALETATRKIILPIWKDVSRNEVLAFSPILADIVAVLASDGLKKVVEEIHRAIDVSIRMREISHVDTATQRILKLTQTYQEERVAAVLQASAEGASLIGRDFLRLFDTIQSVILQVPKDGALTFKTTRPASPNATFYVQTSQLLTLVVRLRELAINSASGCYLSAKIYQEYPSFLEEPRRPDEIWSENFKPEFRPAKEVMWYGPSKESYAEEQLAAYLLEKLFERLEEKPNP